jgi:flavin-dependent dehydrogenase
MKPDILVLGAGPAGIAISLLLAEKGYSVEAIDSCFFPRSKICGEFLNPQAVNWLRDRGLLDSLLQAGPYPVQGMKVSDPQGNSFVGRYLGDQTGYAIMRREFDTLMVSAARKAGIKIREGFRAERLLLDGERVIGIAGQDSDGQPAKQHARVVIGADGRNNLIGRTFGWMSDIPDLRKYAFQAYFENLPDLDHFGEVHIVPGGYVGIAPLGDALANVALVVDEKAYPRDSVPKRDFLMNAIRNSALAQRFSGLEPATPVMNLGPLAFRMKRLSGHGSLVVGDTCGFIDPFTGEGINYAFLSANLAARILDAALRNQNLGDAVLEEYDRERGIVMSRKIQMAALLQKAISRPGASRYLVRKFAQRIELGDAMVSAVGSAIPVERIWNLRFLLQLAFG